MQFVVWGATAKGRTFLFTSNMCTFMNVCLHLTSSIIQYDLLLYYYWKP